jgi:hypothetical protein
MRLHQTRTVILMLHSDCGAYGGLSAFENDSQREAEHHRQELSRAAQVLKSEIPELLVQTYFVDFEGVWETESEVATAVRIA